MKRHLIKVEGKWQLVFTSNVRMHLGSIVHITEARRIAKSLGVSLKHSTFMVCDYFGGNSKVYDFSHRDSQWVIE